MSTSANELTWLGHSTVAIRLDGVLVVTDPVLRTRIAHLRRRRAADPAVLEGLSAVLLSHLHYDHLDLPSLALLDRRLPVLVPTGAAGLLRRRGFGDVRELSAGDELELGPLRVRATHAEHAAARRLGTGRTEPLGFVLEGTRSIYFAGDTDLFAAMAALAPLDVALLPVAGWGTRLPPGHLDPERAARALLLLQPQVAIPIHWGTYAAWRARPTDDAPAQAFAAAAARVAPAVTVRVLRPGETYRLI